MVTYIPTIGLEIHAELKTKTKMFCNSKNDADETRPNVNVCPVCMAHPGTLPTINKEAVRHVLRIGAAIDGELADFTEFDRKNYFYPDIPKAYQISQYKFPLVSKARLAGVDITRIHLEEDTASSQHIDDEGSGHSIVNYNRAGVPLMELVTEPVIHSGEEAGAFARELQLLLQYLGAGDANMEKGEMRVEANISIAPEGEPFGTKVEVKNLNSFKSAEKAIAYEIERHKQVLEDGGEIIQETRGWDEVKEVTFSQRVKESSDDYRYFPDPDLPKIFVSEIPEFSREELKKDLPELPWERRERYLGFGLSEKVAQMFTKQKVFGDFFDAVLKEIDSPKTIANYLSSDVAGIIKNEKIDPKELFEGKEKMFAELVKMVDENVVSSRGAKDMLGAVLKEGRDPEALADELGLKQSSDPEAVRDMVKEVIAENADAVEKYKGGNENMVKFLMGQGMKKSLGSANPQVLEEVILEELRK